MSWLFFFSFFCLYSAADTAAASPGVLLPTFRHSIATIVHKSHISIVPIFVFMAMMAFVDNQVIGLSGEEGFINSPIRGEHVDFRV